MRSLTIAVALGACACSVVLASYTYYFTDSLTTINTSNWTQNGTVSAGANGITSASSGALISKVAVPNGAQNYEVRTILNLTTNGGNFFSYLRASSNALDGTSGTFYATEISNPTFSGSACTATASILKSVNGTITSLASTSISCHNGVEIRTLITTTNGIMLYVDGYLSIDAWDSAIATGQPAIGVSSSPAGNTISLVQLGSLTQIAPTVNTKLIGASASATQVNLQWSGAFTPDPNGTGIAFYYLVRNSDQTYFFNSDSEAQHAFADDTVTAGTQYSYQVEAFDYDWNSVTATVTVTIPPAGAIDPRRVGMRPTGSYWGGAGEQIDTLSGNLNFSTTLFSARGRGGSSVPFALSNNSQFWRQDPGGTWQLGRDIGYGLGWKLQAGSITPVFSNNWTIDHYLFIDSTGAEYRLTVNTNAVWTSTEGIYVSFNQNNNTLYLPNGSFWVMGAASGGVEQDAGTMYPTTMEDSNGNQIFIRYNTGLGAIWPNSCSRISEIEDVRAIFNSSTGTYQSYTFTYNTDAIPHLTQINNVLGNGSENYTLGYLENQTLSSPFSRPPVSFGTTTLLQSLAVTNLGISTSFTYDTITNSGELTSMTTPFGGKIRWAYGPFTYNGTRTLREVQNRYLTMTSGGAETAAYVFTRPTGDSNLSLHSGLTIDDPSGIGEKAWTFATSGSAALLGTTTQYQDRPSAALASTPLQSKIFTWVLDTLGNPYIGTVLTALNPTGANMQSQTTQTMDTYGNVLTSNIYDYPSLTTPARTYTNTYLTSNSNYTSRYIDNRLVTSIVSNSSLPSVTLANNTYDSTNITNLSGVREHDANYTTGMYYRGNVTVASPAGGATVTTNYDIGGNMVTAADPVTTTSVSTSSTTNYAVPTVITPNSNSNLQTTASYTSWLSMGSVTGPNSTTASTTYDPYGRPYTSTSIYGAGTSYGYSNTVPYVITVTTTNSNGTSHYTKTTLDGFGRAITVLRGTGGATVSEVDTVYAPCACSPTGKVQKVSQPYVPGNQPVYTTYTYDGMGRTVSVLLPDGASTTTYAYSGNTTTITDPAGKWKMQSMDAMGELIQVNEPNPAGGANYVTSYTYDLLSHLTQVSMPRPSGTQTRTFVYDSNQRLQSETHPESGTKTYTYNADATLATRVDARGQKTVYTYDAYKRITMKQYYPSGTTEDTCQRLTVAYDQGTNGWGRPYTDTWGASSTCTTGIGGFTMVYKYGYTPAGQVTGKTLTVNRTSPTYGNGVFAASYSYDNEGRVTSIAYPDPATGLPSTVPYNYAYDGMERPTGISTTYNGNTTNQVWNTQYGPSDELLQWNHGTFETFQYNSMLQLTQEFDYLYYNGYQYDYSATQNNGRILQRTGYGETVSYTYDTLNRLSTASSTAGWGTGYAYDGFGNLTDKNVTAGSAPSLHVTINATTNQIQCCQGPYDNNGNLVGANNGYQSGYQYDAENRVTAVLNLNTGNDLYGYDPSNLRVYKKEPSGKEWMFFYGANGELLASYFLTGGAWQGNGNSLYFAGRRADAVDRLGSEVVSATNGYYPYGEQYTTTTQDAFSFATYYRDQTSGLDYAKNRYYSNTLGRFLTADPYRATSKGANNPGDPGSWNRYVYAGDDPVNFNDPPGLFKKGIDKGNNGGDGGGVPIDFGEPGPGPGQVNGPPGGGGGGGGGSGPLKQGSPSFTAAYDVLTERLGALYQGFMGPQSEPCEKDLQAVGVTNVQMATATTTTSILNGLGIAGATNTVASLYSNSPAANAAITQFGSVTIAQYMSINTGIVALSQLNGSNIYINAAWVNGMTNTQQMALMLHELLHNVTGLGDSSLQSDLGIPTTNASQNIGDKLEDDCFLTP